LASEKGENLRIKHRLTVQYCMLTNNILDFNNANDFYDPKPPSAGLFLTTFARKFFIRSCIFKSSYRATTLQSTGKPCLQPILLGFKRWFREVRVPFNNVNWKVWVIELANSIQILFKRPKNTAKEPK